MDRRIEHSTGEMVAIYLQENGLTVRDLADVAGVSQKSVYLFLSDEARLSSQMAIALERLIPSLTAVFTMAYDAQYQLQKDIAFSPLKQSQVLSLAKHFDLRVLFPDDRNNLMRLFDDGVSMLGYQNFIDRVTQSPHIPVLSFARAKNYDDEKSKLWVYAARERYLKEGKELLPFDEETFEKSFDELFVLAGAESITATIANMSYFCRKCGINFALVKSYRGSQAMGASFMDSQGHLFVLLSDLFKRTEHLWIVMIHELLHIRDKDYNHIEYDDANPRSPVEAGKDESVQKMFIRGGVDLSSTVVQSLDDITRIALPGAPLHVVALLYQRATNDYGNHLLLSFRNRYELNEGQYV